MGTLRIDGFPNTADSLTTSLIGIGECDPWFPAQEAIHALHWNPTHDAIHAAEVAINKAVDETVSFEA